MVASFAFKLLPIVYLIGGDLLATLGTSITASPSDPICDDILMLPSNKGSGEKLFIPLFLVLSNDFPTSSTF